MNGIISYECFGLRIVNQTITSGAGVELTKRTHRTNSDETLAATAVPPPPPPMKSISSTSNSNSSSSSSSRNERQLTFGDYMWSSKKHLRLATTVRLDNLPCIERQNICTLHDISFYIHTLRVTFSVILPSGSSHEDY